VAASVIGRIAFGDVPAFVIPVEYGINSFWEFLLYPILGILAAGAGALFIRVLYWSEDVFAKWKSVPEWLQPMVGGLLLGGMGLAYPLVTGVTWTRMPQVFNVGYDVIESALASKLTLAVVLTLLVLKLIATSLTLGSGGSGGVFAPSLFMGAMLGTAFEIVANNMFPGIAAPPGAYALVGMAAMFAATAHAPITAILILFELTGDYRIILPMMLTVVLATLLAQLLLKGESIYTLKLTRRGIRLERGRDLDIMHGVQVEEVMSHEVNTITKDATLKQLSEVFNRTKRHGLVVLDEHGKLWGIVTISDLERALSDDLPADTTQVATVAVESAQLLVAYPDQSMGEALAMMAKVGIGRMPVVSREDARHLVGWIRREDILGAYNLALTRKAEIQQHTKQMQLRNVDGTEFTELALVANDRAVGKEVHELADKLPKDCVLIAIRRDGRVLIPHGDTILQEGDLVTAFIRSDQVETFYGCFKSSSD
jgi:CIC family chloride channel protein